jgi:23S rRNA (cytosine1962-C5)-methyltransferase
MDAFSLLASVRVNRKGADRIASGHLWIFSSDVLDRGEAQPGAPVRVLDPAHRPIGTAHYSDASQIALRLLSPRVEPIDRAFLCRRLEAASAYRRRVVSDSDAYRLVYGEADLLPGLVVDRYGDYLVLQTLDQGMARMQADIVECLQELLSPVGIVARNDAAVRARENLPREVSVLHGSIPDRVPIRMNGLSLDADLLRGQKTGIYLDQRENYVAAAAYARGHVLDCFTSTGGFALHMAARAESVEAVDSSADALAAAQSNCARNGIGNVRFHQADVFELLTQYASARRQYSTVVLDPPAFTKSRRTVDDALRGYKDINLRALRLLTPEGVLVTCSCSHHVSEADLLEVVASAALDAGRILRVRERRTQAQDHPVLLTVPETHYLKCLILETLPG